IVEQFLIECTVMSSSGGIIGVLLGIGVPPLVSHLSGMPVVIRPWSPVIAFLIALSIGVIFGVYPARRAALLDPVEGLRHGWARLPEWAGREARPARSERAGSISCPRPRMDLPMTVLRTPDLPT